MGKYEAVLSEIFSVFGSDAWKSTSIKTVPANFGGSLGEEYILVHVIPSGGGIMMDTVKGLLLIEIHVEVGNTAIRTAIIADKLDGHLTSKTLHTDEGGSVICNVSALGQGKLSKSGAHFVTPFSVPFCYYKKR